MGSSCLFTLQKNQEGKGPGSICEWLHSFCAIYRSCLLRLLWREQTQCLGLPHGGRDPRNPARGLIPAPTPKQPPQQGGGKQHEDGSS